MAEEKDYASLLARMYPEINTRVQRQSCTWRRCRTSSDLRWLRLYDEPREQMVLLRFWDSKGAEHPTQWSDCYSAKLTGLYLDWADRFGEMLVKAEKQDALLETIGRRTERLLASSETQHKEHGEIIGRCEMLELHLRKQQEENTELRLLLGRKYSAERLLGIASAAFFAFAASLILSFASSVTVVHPALAIIGTFVSGAFVFLGFWRRASAN